MTGERIEILKMVAEKKVTAEEAERLLRALDEGQSQRHRQAPGPSSAPRFERGMFGLGGLIEEVGSTVQEAMQDAMATLGVSDPHEGLAHVQVENGAFALPAGSTLTISQRGLSTGDVELVPGEGEIGKFAQGDHVRALQGKDGVVLLPSGGLKLAVPPGVRSLTISLRGGAVRGAAMPGPMSIRTMGGEVALTQVLHPLELRTMGGKVRLGLEPSIAGDCTIATMGGSVELVVPDSLALRIEAHTMGGKIELDGERLSRDGGVVTLGPEGAPQLTVHIKTTGGKVRLRRSRG
jgi:hypothetical protein